MFFSSVGATACGKQSSCLFAVTCLIWTFTFSYGSKIHSDRNITGGGQRPSAAADDNLRRLTITTILDPPYMMLKPDSAFLAGNERFEGYLADILKQLAHSVGFEYEIRLSRDGKHGDLHMERVWDGMLGDIQRGDADMAAGALIVTDKRREFFDFTDPFLSLRSSALVRKPHQQQKRTSNNQHKSHSSKAEHAQQQQQQRQRNSQQVTSTPAPRVRRIHTASQLLASDLTYGVVRHSVVERSMSGSSDPLTRALWSRIATFWPPGLVDSVQEGVERARRDHFAFIVDSPMAAYVAGRAPCDLYATEPFLDPMTYAFAMRRPSTLPTSGTAATTTASAASLIALRQAVDSQLRRMKNTGEMQAMYLRWWRDECGPDFGADDGGRGANANDDRFDIPDSAVGRSRDATPPSAKTGRHVISSTADGSIFVSHLLLLICLSSVALLTVKT